MALNRHIGIFIILISFASLGINIFFNFSHVLNEANLRKVAVFQPNTFLKHLLQESDDFYKSDLSNDTLYKYPNDSLDMSTNGFDKNEIKSLFPHYPHRTVTATDCKAIIRGSQTDIMSALDYMKEHPRKSMTDLELAQFAQNCTALKERGYITEKISQEELDFPLAFSILMYQQAIQSEMLLRILYRPQNTYCIHIDLKAPNETVKAMEAVANCFPNVFLAKKREFIVYASIRRLQAELNCMEESLVKSPDWKYYMNYASTMFPLKTNLEMVRILKVFNGTNDINGLKPIENRIKYSYKFFHAGGRMRLMRTKTIKSPPPLGMNITKGSIYATYTREFCKFMLEDSVSKKLLAWSQDTWSPDEHFAATLHHVGRNDEVLGEGIVPGSYTGPLSGKTWFGTYAHWSGSSGCPTKYAVHGICINGLRSLQKIAAKPHFSANKFYLEFEPLAWDCMEEWYFNKTFSKFNLSLELYGIQPFVNNNWMKKKKRVKKIS